MSNEILAILSEKCEEMRRKTLQKNDYFYHPLKKLTLIEKNVIFFFFELFIEFEN